MKIIFDIYTAFKTALTVTQIFSCFLSTYFPVHLAEKKKKILRNLISLAGVVAQ